MRDSKQIKLFLKELEAFWLAHPDLRFGQIVENMFSPTGEEHQCIFYIEDDEFLRGLDNLSFWLQTHEKSQKS